MFELVATLKLSFIEDKNVKKKQRLKCLHIWMNKKVTTRQP